MCKKQKGLHNRIDKCMKPLIRFLNERNVRTVASCCGHNKYPITIVVKDHWDNVYRELFTNIIIPREKKFYVKDKQGYYYIPEVSKEKTD